MIILGRFESTVCSAPFKICNTAADIPIYIVVTKSSSIHISSVVGFSGNAGQFNYSATKAGVIGMTKSAALECASRGIRVNAVAPGFIETDMTASISDDMKAAYMEKIPLKSLGKPEDIANAVIYLASPLSDYMTGQTLHLNGGMYL